MKPRLDTRTVLNDARRFQDLHTVTNGSIQNTLEHKKKFTFVEDKVYPKKLINDIRGHLIPVNYRKDIISKDHFAMLK